MRVRGAAEGVERTVQVYITISVQEQAVMRVVFQVVMPENVLVTPTRLVGLILGVEIAVIVRGGSV